MIIQEDIEQEIKEIIKYYTGDVSISLLDKIGVDFFTSKTIFEEMVKDIAVKYNITIYSKDYNSWMVVSDIVETVCNSLLNDGYIVILRKDIKEI